MGNWEVSKHVIWKCRNIFRVIFVLTGIMLVLVNQKIRVKSIPKVSISFLEVSKISIRFHTRLIWVNLIENWFHHSQKSRLVVPCPQKLILAISHLDNAPNYLVGCVIQKRMQFSWIFIHKFQNFKTKFHSYTLHFSVSYQNSVGL